MVRRSARFFPTVFTLNMNLPTSWPIMSDPCNTTFLLSLSADTPFLPGNFCSLVSQGLCRSDIANTTPLVVHPPPLKAEVWGYGFLSVLIVSLSSVVGAIFLPLMKQESFGKILIGMIGLAVGCLSGGAIFHLIPQAFQLHGDTDEELEGYLYKALVIVAAIFAFFLIERVMKLWMNWKDHRVIADGMALSSSYRRGSRYSPKLDSKVQGRKIRTLAAVVLCSRHKVTEDRTVGCLDRTGAVPETCLTVCSYVLIKNLNLIREVPVSYLNRTGLSRWNILTRDYRSFFP